MMGRPRTPYAKIRDAVSEIVADGGYPSDHNIMRKLGIRGTVMTPIQRQIKDAVMLELGIKKKKSLFPQKK